MTELDKIVRRSLVGFVDAINTSRWSGQREREAISLYVLGHLQNEVEPRSVLFDVRQIGIEMPVKQIPSEKQLAISGRKGRPKADVAKDVLIWPRPQMTTWTSDAKSCYSPLAIQEWKMGSLTPFKHDVLWLEEYSKLHGDFAGYVVSLRRDSTGVFALNVVRVGKGKRELNWLRCDGASSP